MERTAFPAVLLSAGLFVFSQTMVSPEAFVEASSGFILSTETPVFTKPGREASDQISVGQNLLIEARIAYVTQGADNAVVDFVGILQIRDLEGVTVDLLWQSGTVSADQPSSTITFDWAPESVGAFSYVFFVLSSTDDAPEVLSAASYDELTVIDGGNIITGPLNGLGDGGDKSEDQAAKQLANYTFMVYMVGSDLETFGYYATEDVAEMMDAAPYDSDKNENSANIIIQTGGSRNASVDSYRFIDFTKVQTHKVFRDEIQLLQDLGSQNMGDPATLSSFLNYATKEFPAEKYVIILWNDGSGIGGFGTDTISQDHLSLSEIHKAFSDASKSSTNQKFELIGFDACLMASIEVLSELDEFGSVMVASQELEPGWGWNYYTIVQGLQDNPDQTGFELGRTIADSYASHVDAKAKEFEEYNTSDTLTLSVIDLSKIAALESAVSRLSDAFDEELNDLGAANTYAKAIGRTERFGIGSEFSSGHVDLYHLSYNIGLQFPELRESASEVQKLTDEAVVYKINRTLHQDSRGISMYMPEGANRDSLTTNQSSDSYTFSRWDNIITKFRSLLRTDIAAPVLDYVPEYYDEIIRGEVTATDLHRLQILVATEVLEGTTYQVVAYSEQDIGNTITKEGRFSYNVDKKIISLCNGEECAPAWMYSYASGTTNYAIFPVRLESNDGAFDGVVSLIYQKVNSTSFKFIGAWPGIDEEGNASRELLPLQRGDKIHVIGYQADIRNGEKYNKIVESRSLKVIDENFGPAFHTYDGRFFIALGFCDFAGNCNYTPTYEFESSTTEQGET